jgi:hypothetical protein
MVNRVATGIIGLTLALSLGACAGNVGADSSGGPDESVASSSEKLVYGHVWDTFEGGSNNGHGYRTQYYDPQATAELESWGMPVAVEDYCANINPGANPSCWATNQTWTRFRLTPGGSFTAWKPISNASVTFEIGTQWNDPGGLSIGCVRTNGNIFCSVGTGGPGFSAYIESKYGS